MVIALQLVCPCLGNFTRRGVLIARAHVDHTRETDNMRVACAAVIVGGAL
jgi:hypothetical protein